MGAPVINSLFPICPQFVFVFRCVHPSVYVRGSVCLCIKEKSPKTTSSVCETHHTRPGLLSSFPICFSFVFLSQIHAQDVVSSLGSGLSENKSNRVRTTDAFWLTARVLVFESSSKWHTFLFLMLFCSNLAYFSKIQLVCDGPTDRRTDGHTLL